MTSQSLKYLTVILSGALVACATTSAPKELLDARAAYVQGQNGKAHALDPAGLHEAKVALDRAEAAFLDEPGSDSTKDLSYIAWRRAQRSELEASTTDWEAKRTAAESTAAKVRAQEAQKTQGELTEVKQKLEAERVARAAAETRTKEVLDRLVAANAAAVKQEPRGTVITLSGSVLFASGKSAVQPGAQASLGQIAEAIGTDKTRKILVEGHTDTQGTPESNLSLSQARAQSVAQFLSAHGIEAARVTATGLGGGRPVADNGTPEGRATNRRVEIVIQAQ